VDRDIADAPDPARIAAVIGYHDISALAAGQDTVQCRKELKLIAPCIDHFSHGRRIGPGQYL